MKKLLSIVALLFSVNGIAGQSENAVEYNINLAKNYSLVMQMAGYKSGFITKQGKDETKLDFFYSEYNEATKQFIKEFTEKTEVGYNFINLYCSDEQCDKVSDELKFIDKNLVNIKKQKYMDFPIVEINPTDEYTSLVNKIKKLKSLQNPKKNN